MFAEEQIGARDIALDIRLARVVNVDATPFNVLWSLALARTEAGLSQQLRQLEAAAIQLGFLDCFRRNLPDDFVEGRLRNSFESTAEQDFAGARGFLGRRFAVDQVGQGCSQGSMRF